MVNIVFGVAIALVLLTASILELRSLQQVIDRRMLHNTRKNINYLESYAERARAIDTGTLGLCEPPDMKWLKAHIAGSMVEKREYTAELEEAQFLLKKYPKMLARSIPRSSLRFVPGVLAGMGILGTFAGIWLGLQKITLDATVDFPELVASVEQLLGGMRIAFSTSLQGLGASILFTLLLAWSERQRKYHHQLRHRLDRSARPKVPSGSSLTEEIAQLVRLQRQALENSSSFDASSIGAHIGESIAFQLTPISQELKQMPAAVGERMKEAIAPITRQLQTQILQPFTEHIDTNVRLARETSERAAELASVLEKTTENLTESAKTIQKFQNANLDQFQEFTREIEETFDRLQANAQEFFQQINLEMQRSATASVKGLEKQRVAFISSTEQASSTFQGIRTELQQALVSQVQNQKEMLKTIELEIQQILANAERALDRQSQELTTIGSESSRIMNEASNTLRYTLEGVDDSLQKTRLTVEEELHRFREDYQLALEKFFSEQNAILMEILEQQRQEIEKLNRAKDR